MGSESVAFGWVSWCLALSDSVDGGPGLVVEGSAYQWRFQPPDTVTEVSFVLGRVFWSQGWSVVGLLVRPGYVFIFAPSL